MAKKKDNTEYTIPEYIDHMVENNIVEENGSPAEVFETYTKLLDIKDNTADLIKSYKERGWDDNRIAARLMITVKQVKES
jgi:hypothetical protein